MNSCRTKMTGLAVGVFLSVGAFAFEYNVTKPAIRPRWSGAVAGEWTMDYKAALEKAQNEGKCTLLMFTGAWWCPYCETGEEKVLTAAAWQKYVEEKGFYLVEFDYPYRFPVPEGQEWKGTSPLGDGWGFQCWLYDAEYLAENGLTAEEGLAAIQERYDFQDANALPGSTVNTISRYDGGTMDLHKIGYMTLIAILPDGTEAGRVSFPWYKSSSVSIEEACDYVITSLDTVIDAAIEAQCGLCSDPEAGGLDGTAREKYDGWITDASGGVVGTVSFTVVKANRKGVMKASAIVSQSGSRKQYKATITDGYHPVKFTSSHNSYGTLNVRFGSLGLTGTLTDESGTYEIKGGRDVFSARDAESKKSAESLAQGVWNVVVQTAEPPTALAAGNGYLSVEIKGRGRASVSGVLGDGTKVKLSGRVIVGEDGVSCLPLWVAPYSRRQGSIGCVLWFRDGKLFNVNSITPWTSGGENPFSTTWKAVFSHAPGYELESDEMELDIEGLEEGTLIKGKPVVVDPADDEVSVKGGIRFRGSSTTGFSGKITPKNGVFSGRMTLFVDAGNVKPKKVSAKMTGAVMSGTVYGSLLVPKVASWPLKISSCNACSD